MMRYLTFGLFAAVRNLFSFFLSTHLDCEVLTLAPKSQTISP